MHMNDTRATLALARLLYERVPEGWKWMLGMGTKSGVHAALRSNVLCLTDWYFGSPYSFMVSEGGRCSGSSSEIGVFDLAHDPTPYLNLSSDRLNAHLTGK